MSNPDRVPVFYRPFSLPDLIATLQEVERRVPGATVGRSRGGTGNLLIYDANGGYIGVVELHDTPSFTLFAEGGD